MIYDSKPFCDVQKYGHLKMEEVTVNTNTQLLLLF